MAAAVRPGGWLCIEEGDYGMSGSADPTHPEAERFTRTYRGILDAMHAQAVMDPYFGRQVPKLLEGLGFVELGHDGATWVSRGQDAGACFSRLGIGLLRETMIADRVVTAEDCSILERLLEEPEFTFVGFVLFGAWGRRASS
jgi:hypothetical protein